MKTILLCTAELMLGSCGHMAEMPSEQQSCSSRSRVRNTNMFLFLRQARADHCLVHLPNYALSLCVQFVPRFDIHSVSVPSSQKVKSVLCVGDHSPGLLAGRLRQEGFDTCEHDAGTFGEQKILLSLTIRDTIKHVRANLTFRSYNTH